MGRVAMGHANVQASSLDTIAPSPVTLVELSLAVLVEENVYCLKANQLASVRRDSMDMLAI